MTASTSFLAKRFNGPMQAMGGFFRMCVLTAKALARPFQWKEFLNYSWFLMTVALLPTFAMSIPLTVLIIFIFNLLLPEFGAADVSGAGAALASVTQLGPLVTVLVVAGAGSNPAAGGAGLVFVGTGKGTNSAALGAEADGSGVVQAFTTDGKVGAGLVGKDRMIAAYNAAGSAVATMGKSEQSEGGNVTARNEDLADDP